MKIAHITATFPPYYGGGGNVCLHNALELARRGHQVTVFTAAYEGEFHDPPELEVRRLPALFRFGNAPFLPGLLGIKNFDIIHLHYPFVFGAEMVWAAARRHGIPYIVTHHNDLIGNGLRRYLFDAYFAFSTRLVYGGAAKIGAVSLDHAAACRATPVFRKRWKDVVEIPNGVDVELFQPGLDGRVIRRELSIPQEASVVLFVGVLDRAHHFKGVEHLLRAFARLKPSGAALMIVGDGDLKPFYIRLAEELGIARQTCFPGRVAHQDLPPYFAASDMVVLPSFPPESFGMVLIEGMACGKPVIASDLPGVRSVVSDAMDGLLAQPGDMLDLAEKIQRLLEDPIRCRELGRCGREKVERKYTWPQVTTRLECAYREALADAAV